MKTLRVLIAVGIGVALADASIVTLALPRAADRPRHGRRGRRGGDRDLHARPRARPAGRRARAARPAGSALGALGFAVFAIAGGFCAASDTLTSMLVFRTLQALGAAAALVAGFALLGGGGRLWVAAAVFGTAVGPALGGALTQAFDWRAIFASRFPWRWPPPPRRRCARGAMRGRGRRRAGPAARCGRTPPPPRPTSRPRRRRARPRRPRALGRPGAWVALAALSAALTGVLFLLVLLLVSGWSLDPLTAALAVSVLPIAAVAGERIPGAAATRATPAARSSAAASSPSPCCPTRRSPGSSCRRSSRAPGWAWRCPRSPASCCPSARRARPRTCSPSATPASPSRCCSSRRSRPAQLDSRSRRARAGRGARSSTRGSRRSTSSSWPGRSSPTSTRPTRATGWRGATPS